MEEHSNNEKSSVDAELQAKLLAHDHQDGHKGGLRTMPFIIANEAFDRIATDGLIPNMIFYLMEVYHMDAVTGTSILSIWSAFSNGLSIFGAFIADSYFGRFPVIAIGCLSSLLGITLLWLTSVVPHLTPSSCNDPETTCTTPSSTQLVFLYSAFGLVSVGSGCIRPCSIAFGADQLKHNRNLNNQRLIDSYFNWYYATDAISTGVALTFMIYIQDSLGWQVGFAVSVSVMVGSALVFLLGSALYINVEVSESPFSGFIQVITVAFKNRNLSLRHDDCYNHSKEMDRVELTENLRFLNKACVIRDVGVDSSTWDPWSVSTVEKVESLKSLVRVVPIWSSGILLYVSVSQKFLTLQAKTMNRYITSGFEIPAASFSMFLVSTLAIWLVVYDRLLVPCLAKYTHEARGLHHKTRMGIGIGISILAMMVSAIVETIRRNSTVDMSALWLVPQYALLGLAEAFNAIGQMEFYYSELPKSMSSIAMALFMVSVAVSGLVGSLLINIVNSATSKGGNVSWLSSDINEGHIDYYYWLLSFLNLLNFFYYLICCRAHRRFSCHRRSSRH